MHPRIARQKGVQVIVEQRRVQDRDQFDIAMLQKGAAIARAIFLNRQIRPPPPALLRNRRKREAEPFIGCAHRRQVTRRDAKMVKCQGGIHAGFS